jgi:hypothetical protein
VAWPRALRHDDLDRDALLPRAHAQGLRAIAEARDHLPVDRRQRVWQKHKRVPAPAPDQLRGI